MKNKFEKEDSMQITPGIIMDISNDFKSGVKDIFGDNLYFAFICGSLAKGYAKTQSDIDMFICLKTNNERQLNKFHEFYFDVHKKNGFEADSLDPGEVMLFDNLRSALDLLKGYKIKETIKTYAEYEALVWGDMLAGNKLAAFGDMGVINQI